MELVAVSAPAVADAGPTMASRRLLGEPLPTISPPLPLDGADAEPSDRSARGRSSYSAKLIQRWGRVECGAAVQASFVMASLSFADRHPQPNGQAGNAPRIQQVSQEPMVEPL